MARPASQIPQPDTSNFTTTIVSTYACKIPSDWECSSFSRNCFAVKPDLFTGVSEGVSSHLEEPHAGRLDIPDVLKKGHLEVLHELNLENIRKHQGKIPYFPNDKV